MPYRIYLVEDHPVMREAYAAVFDAAPGFELCGTAESAEELLGKLGELDCDLVVTDYRLPGMTGAEPSPARPAATAAVRATGLIGSRVRRSCGVCGTRGRPLRTSSSRSPMAA